MSRTRVQAVDRCLCCARADGACCTAPQLATAALV
eukprot:CAMPEP_0203952028 /NCGR_PEP_ID=MMETSP0359-20131031/85777_1 /ASSEMBLY_ACC=CAM_ASM_000338 /TAXON_ID=268821 /ORGANISM="Scrippsiella Hangoei, Strain SHTV-5" /LENGTH=34 /DNA_ID= /DNA_START= /DNA_END= /DNA_ORIENTATION=